MDQISYSANLKWDPCRKVFFLPRSSEVQDSDDEDSDEKKHSRRDGGLGDNGLCLLDQLGRRHVMYLSRCRSEQRVSCCLLLCWCVD